MPVLAAAVCAAALMAARLQQGPVAFNPPKPEEAPAGVRPLVMRGYDILRQTQKSVPQYVGNKLDCSNCHFDAGRERRGLPLAGVTSEYPKYDKLAGRTIDLATRVDMCFERSENGKPLPRDSRDMKAVLAYLGWISKDVPAHAEVPWLEFHPLETGHKPDAQAGKKIHAEQCSACHGGNGEGTPIAPPLWGPQSFSSGAGMAENGTLAAFVHEVMPMGNPNLTNEQALDVAAYVDSRPRPRFAPRGKD
jgi:thiosulfate dehydrogenase